MFRLSRIDFYRMFKVNSDCWDNTLAFAAEKERSLIKRCKSYLHTGKKVVEKAQARYRQTVE